MTITQQIITVAAGVVATMLTRFVPFVVFRPGRPTPKYIMYLGRVLPASVFAMLVVYCLRNVSFVERGGLGDSVVPGVPNDTLAQLAGVAVTVLVHVWRRNMMWSIAAGTLCYMVLVNII